MTTISNSPDFWSFIVFDFKSASVAPLAIVFYDYVLVLRREIDLIWCERWSITTILYAIARYLGLAVVISQIWLAPGYIIQGFYVFGMVSLACTMHAIMAVRIFAMYRRSKKMLIFLIICVIAASASRAAVDGVTLSPMSGSIQEYTLSGTGLCTTATIMPYMDSIPSICIELLFFLLASRVFVKHLLEMRRACPDWGFDDCLSILFRDHLLHFSFYLISNVMQVIAMFGPVNGNSWGGQWYDDITFLLVVIQQCVLVPRLVISIREYNYQLAGAPGSATMDLSTVAFASNRHESYDISAST